MRLGEPESALELLDLPEPVPSAGQVVLNMEAAALGFPDLLLCRGAYHDRPALPFALGAEGVGTVVSTGPEADVPLGARCIANPGAFGTVSERFVAEAADLLPVPVAMRAAHAAALFVAYQTSYVALHRRARLEPGETLLVHAGMSGVGTAAIQLGVAAGALVLATAGSARKVEACRELGAQHAFDYTSTDFVEAVREVTAGRGADVIVDPVGADVFTGSCRCVAVEGRIVVVGFAGGRIPELSVNRALFGNFSVVGLRMRPFRSDPDYRAEVHAALLDLYSAGRIEPVVEEVDFEHAPAHLARLRDRSVVGRLVVRAPG